MKEDNCTILLGTLFVLFVSYLVYSTFFFKKREGLETATAGASSSISSANGIAGNAATYAATIKQKTVNLNDTLLISKYRKDYETQILNVDDFVNSMMLKTVASIDTSSANTPSKMIESMKLLNELSAAKESLNKVMKFVENAP
jgi:hypothetical protein